MTSVRFRIGPTCTAVRVRPIVRYTSSTGVTLPQAVTHTLVAGTVTASIEPSTADFCYEVREVGVDGATRFVTVADSVDTLDYEDLPDVDPATFDEVVEPGTAWSASLTGETAARLAGDAAGSAALSAAVSALTLTVVASAANYPGIDPTGVTDCSTALQASLDAVPDGGTWEFPRGVYQCAGLVSTGKSIHIRASQATFVQAQNLTILTLRGAWDSAIPVVSIASVNVTIAGLPQPVAELTFAAPPAWVLGDRVRVFSDDVIPEGRPEVSAEMRKGEFAVVYEVVGNAVRLMGPLQDGGYDTAPQAARMQSKTVTIDRWSSYTPDAGLTALWNYSQLFVASMVQPTIGSVSIAQGGGSGVILKSCHSAFLSNVNVSNLADNPGNGQYGYGVSDYASEGTTIVGGLWRRLRHGYTTDCGRVAAGSTDPEAHGRCRGGRIVGVRAEGTTSAAFDTHHGSEFTTFTDCVATGCAVGFSLRGRYERVVNPVVVGCRTGLRCFVEPEGGQVYGCEFVNSTVRGSVVGADVSDILNHGWVVATFTGGRIEALASPLLTDSANVHLTGGVVFAASAADTTGRKVFDLFDSAVTVDNAGADMTAWGATGSTIRPVRLNDSTSSLTGRRFVITVGGNGARVTSFMLGTSGSLGTVALTDVYADVAPGTLWIQIVSTSSHIQYRTAAGLSSSHEDRTGLADSYIPVVSSFDPVILKTYQSTAARDLGAFQAGKFAGQQLTIRNGNAAFVITVKHGGAYLTECPGAADFGIAAGKSITFIWNGTAWLAVNQSA